MNNNPETKTISVSSEVQEEQGIQKDLESRRKAIDGLKLNNPDGDQERDDIGTLGAESQSSVAAEFAALGSTKWEVTQTLLTKAKLLKEQKNVTAIGGRTGVATIEEGLSSFGVANGFTSEQVNAMNDFDFENLLNRQMGGRLSEFLNNLPMTQEDAIVTLRQTEMTNKEILLEASQFESEKKMSLIGRLAKAVAVGSSQVSIENASFQAYALAPAWQNADASAVYNLIEKKLGKEEAHKFIASLVDNGGE